MNTSPNLTIPRGKVYFGEFASDKSSIARWIDLGNCTETTFFNSFDTVKDYDSVNGQLVISDIYTVANKLSCNISTDDLKASNLALWGNFDRRITSIGGPVSVTKQINRNDFVMLDSIPDASLSVVDNLGRSWIHGVDFVYDQFLGGFQILNSNYIASATSVRISYFSIVRNTNSYSYNPKIEPREGALKYISYNPLGPRYNYTFHRVRLLPSQSHTLTADPNNIDWSKLELQVEVLLKDGRDELYSMTTIAQAVLTRANRMIVTSDNKAFATFTEI